VVDPTLVVGAGIEITKLIAQLYFAAARQANLTEEDAMKLLDSERERFKANIEEPLNDVS
jgi:hypothetical protein